jgi:hypothetical protein
MLTLGRWGEVIAWPALLKGLSELSPSQRPP